MGFKLHIRKGLVVYFYCGVPVPEYLVMDGVLNPCLLWTCLGSTVPSPLAPLNKNKVFTQLVHWEGCCSCPSRTLDQQGSMSQTHGIHTGMTVKSATSFLVGFHLFIPLQCCSRLSLGGWGIGTLSSSLHFAKPLKYFPPRRAFLTDLNFSMKQNLSKGK